MLTRLLTAALLLALAPMAHAETKTGFVNKTFKNADGTESPYVVYVPPGYDESKPLPVILFLHGSGESKGGSTPPIEQGLMMPLSEASQEIPRDRGHPPKRKTDVGRD